MVYDVTQRMSLEHCLQWKKEIDDVVQLSNGDPIPIVLIANKVCVRVCVSACVCVCLRACVSPCVCLCVSVCAHGGCACMTLWVHVMH